jgi:hypothetical protein
MRFLTIVALILCVDAVAGELKYPAKEIPEELKVNNYAVIREKVTEYRVLAVNKSSGYFREVITILNPNGNFLVTKVLYYDRLSKVQNINASIYDEDGYLIRKLKASDIKDESAYDGFSLYSDSRLKKIDLTHNSYPYTVEIEYETVDRYLFAFPDFLLYDDDEVAIQSKSYNVYYPENLKIKYKLIGAPEPKHSKEGATEKLSWHFANIKPAKFEKFSPDARTFIPTILISPVEFEYEGYTGSMDTWESLGKWQLQLNKGRDVLPAATKQKIAELTAGKTDREKVKILYKYLQNKTRYVSIQLGIGGWQPFSAETVDQVGYGDCKALSNYMVALLNEIGIKGYYTKVHAGDDGDEDVITDFPSPQSNHIIVAVPMESDTVWLECTSQLQPFNFLGTFTGNRYALMVTDEGGKLVRTPSYKKEKNIQATKAIISLDKTGKAAADVTIEYSGMMYDYKSVGAISKLGSDRQKRWLEKAIQIPAFDLTSFSMKSVEETNPVAQVKCNLFLPNCAVVQGKRIFLQPNLMNKINTVPEKLENRKTDIVVKLPFVEVDTIVYSVPEEIYPEYVPQAVKITSPFGEYEASYRVEPGKLIYTRRFTCNSGTFPKEKYNEFVNFYRMVNQADFTKLVFLNKT